MTEQTTCPGISATQSPSRCVYPESRLCRRRHVREPQPRAATSVKVQKEVVNGDTVMNVTVNGEEINSESFLEDDNKISWIDENGDKKIIMIKMNGSQKDGPMKKEKKIIRKRVEKSSK